METVGVKGLTFALLITLFAIFRRFFLENLNLHSLRCGFTDLSAFEVVNLHFAFLTYLLTDFLVLLGQIATYCEW